MSIISKRKINKSYLPSILPPPSAQFSRTKAEVVMGLRYRTDLLAYEPSLDLVDYVVDPGYNLNMRGYLYLPPGWRFVPDPLVHRGFSAIDAYTIVVDPH
jgi:hypothetical protein